MHNAPQPEPVDALKMAAIEPNKQPGMGQVLHARIAFHQLTVLQLHDWTVSRPS
jgi:hypothetical protein